MKKDEMVHKHLIGQHDQKKHGRKGDHAREEHLNPFLEPILQPTERGRQLQEAFREGFREKKDASFFVRERLATQHVQGERELLKRKRDAERELLREEKNFVHFHLTENPVQTAVTAGLAAAFVRNPNMAREWKRFVERSTSLVRVNRNLSPSFQKIFTSKSQDIAEQTARRMFEGNFGGLRSQVSTVNLKRRTMSVNGAVYDNNNNIVGSWKRTFNRAGEVHHDLLDLGFRSRGTGFSKEFYKHSMNEYKRHGFNQVSMLANISVGGYAWARQNFSFAPGGAIASRSMLAARAPVVVRRHSSYSTRDMLRAQVMSLTPGTRPIDYTKIGRSRSWVDSDGIEHWFGKDLLLGTAWPAIKTL